MDELRDSHSAVPVLNYATPSPRKPFANLSIGTAIAMVFASFCVGLNDPDGIINLVGMLGVLLGACWYVIARVASARGYWFWKTQVALAAIVCIWGAAMYAGAPNDLSYSLRHPEDAPFLPLLTLPIGIVWFGIFRTLQLRSASKSQQKLP